MLYFSPKGPFSYKYVSKRESLQTLEATILHDTKQMQVLKF